ncbi:MAG: serine--tRNA ligase [Patescibacteria group bacterium]
MLDPHFIRAQRSLVAQAIRNRHVAVDIDVFFTLDEKRAQLLQEVEKLRAERNARSKQKPTPAEIVGLKKMGERIKTKEAELSVADERYQQILLAIPNVPHESVPVGENETHNKALKTWGKRPRLTAPLEHFDIPAVKPYLDVERGARTSGARFYYLRGPIAQLERALMQYALDFITKTGFELITPPLLVREHTLFGTGYFPNGRNEVYAVNPGEDNLFLIGTSEQPLMAFHADETLDEKDLPRRYTAFSSCFRREAGSYGKDLKGILRVHQFNKVEMVAFATPKTSWKLLDAMVRLSEKFYQSLKLPYRLVALCTGDLGFQSAKTIDIEGWFPGQNCYRELGSGSNTTDFQSRRLNIKYRDKNGEKHLVHTLNNTVVADRALLAILENYQQKDGSVLVPVVLQKYTRFKKIVAP